VPSNIAEGFRRNGKNDSLHFYNIAQASLEELKYQLLLAKDLKYIKQEEYENVLSMAEEASKLLSGWCKSARELS
jgi:four helix bundle protein